VEAEEAAKAKCEAIQAETFKNLTIEYELQMDAMRDDHMRTIKASIGSRDDFACCSGHETRMTDMERGCPSNEPRKPLICS
jgi:hypothetical protein